LENRAASNGSFTSTNINQMVWHELPFLGEGLAVPVSSPR